MRIESHEKNLVFIVAGVIAIARKRAKLRRKNLKIAG